VINPALIELSVAPANISVSPPLVLPLMLSILPVKVAPGLMVS
jgi:hypothetical protein